MRAGGVLRWARRAKTISSDPQGWMLQGNQPGHLLNLQSQAAVGVIDVHHMSQPHTKSLMRKATLSTKSVTLKELVKVLSLSLPSPADKCRSFTVPSIELLSVLVF